MVSLSKYKLTDLISQIGNAWIKSYFNMLHQILPLDHWVLCCTPLVEYFEPKSFLLYITLDVFEK